MSGYLFILSDSVSSWRGFNGINDVMVVMLCDRYNQYIGLELNRVVVTMTEYDVILLIGGMFTLGVAIVTPILKLNTTITKLRDSIDAHY